MACLRKLLSIFTVTMALLFSTVATADALTDLLNTLGLTQLLSEVGTTVGTVGASVLDPVGTGDNDFLGADALNPENDLGLTLASGELLGFGNKTGSGTAIPLDALGLSQLIGALGLNYESGIVTQLRSLVGPEGAIVVPVVGALEGLTDQLTAGGVQMAQMLSLPGLDGQPIGLALLGAADSGNAAADGLAGIALLTPGSSGNGGIIGLAVLSGNNSGNGDLIGVSVLSGSNSGNGSLAGIAAISGSNSGNSDAVGAAVLSGDNVGNGGSAGLAVLNGDNSGNSDFGAIAVLNGDNSGNSETVAVGALNGANSANGGLVAVGALNGPGSGNGGLITVAVANEAGNGGDGSGGGDAGNCAATGGVGCADRNNLALLDSCKDLDADGVCDDRDECLDTPADMPVFLTGCHLTEDAALVLRGVNFEFDRADLTPESLPILEHAVRVLGAKPAALVAVDGHTDAKGSDDYNIRLSYARAATVYNYLIEAGIEEKRLAYRGYGESVPVASNENDDGSDNPAGRAENRRVELNILDGDVFQSVKEQNNADQ
ncbi:OmpA family protein [Zhongshania aquimaris]|uniref:OmpA family protein n=1 Tax=Zhongshania aquimaris TaxID=2857107 RepID=A0ABS6VNF4_9GAMM|nr:OmpA family protein [Zhongshania aquimaris]MBW2939310.1 OmpA family protein [Zhongshania aquimaris]